MSSMATRCTQETVQKGAHDFFVVYSRSISSTVYRLERDRRVSALLRAVVNQAVLADVEIAASGAALPLVRLAQGQVLVEEIVVSEREEARPALDENLIVDAAFLRPQRRSWPP